MKLEADFKGILKNLKKPKVCLNVHVKSLQNVCEGVYNRSTSLLAAFNRFSDLFLSMSFWSSLIAFKRLVDTKVKYIQKNTPVMLSFLVQLEIWELRVLRRKDLHHKCFFMKPVRFCRTFVSRHQTAGRLLDYGTMIRAGILL